MRSTITVKGSRTSKVCIASGILQEDPKSWMRFAQRRLAIISDSNVAPLYAKDLITKLHSKGCEAKLFLFPSGERHKTRNTLCLLQDLILDWGIDRSSAIIGLGGGVVTDIAGYVAASLMRGIDFISIPTSLLAMVDASVGGKTGVNTRHGKNLIGAFYPATSVLIDPQVLQTLPSNRFLEGVVEMIKHGAIADATYFQDLLHNAKEILQLDNEMLENSITKSIKIKASVVTEDEQEKTGKRFILNFGHTIGHSLELASQYKISHGNAVAIGMVAEAELAVKMKILPPDAKEMLVDALEKYGIETTIPKDLSQKTLLKAMTYDKKNRTQQPRFVMINAIGSCAPFKGAYCSEVKMEMIDALFINKTE